MSNYSGRRDDIVEFPKDRQAVKRRRQKEMAKADNRIVIREYDHIIFICTMFLVAFGLIMVFSASYYSAMHTQAGMFHFLRMQAIGAALGFAAMVVAATFNYQMVAKFAGIFYVVSNILLIYVRIFGRPIQGAWRWIELGPVNIQPSELAKVAVILMLAVYINKDKNRVNTIGGLFGCLMITAIPAGLTLLGRNLSTAIIILAVGFVMVFLSSPYFMRFVVAAGLVFSAGLGYLLYDMHIAGGYRGARLAASMDPFADPTGGGFQIVQSLYALASGGLFGLGLGNSNQKLYFLPEAQNDFIFAIIVEELGLFGGMIVLIFFGILVWRGARAAINSRTMLGCLIATGIITMVSVQVIINVGVVTNTIPNTGIPLPFISYGGTSIAVMMAAVGMLLNISRYQKK